MTTYLPPVERPKGVVKKITYRVMQRMFGVVPTGTKVFVARMPTAFMTFLGKTYRLDKKLALAPETVFVVRQQVSRINTCSACMDIGRYFGLKESADTLTRLDALDEYKSSPLFSEAERAALDYASELTSHKTVSGETFAHLAQHYSEREICDIVWLVASEHLANMTNLGLGVGSDGLCELSQQRRLATVS
jgi:alkylhydroperoxidase family enzyme